VSVSKIASMLEKAIEREQPVLPAAAGSPTARFARDPAEYATAARAPLTLIRGGARTATASTTPKPETTP